MKSFKEFLLGESTFKVGSLIQVKSGSGKHSGKSGTIIDKSKFKKSVKEFDKILPKDSVEDGHSFASNEVVLKLENDDIISMYTDKLIKIDKISEVHGRKIEADKWYISYYDENGDIDLYSERKYNSKVDATTAMDKIDSDEDYSVMIGKDIAKESDWYMTEANISHEELQKRLEVIEKLCDRDLSFVDVYITNLESKIKELETKLGNK